MVDKEEIMKIAILSKLFVADDEIEQLTEDMARIISFMQNVRFLGICPILIELAK